MPTPESQTIVVVKNRTRATIPAAKLKDWQARGWLQEDPNKPQVGLSPAATAAKAAEAAKEAPAPAEKPPRGGK